MLGLHAMYPGKHRRPAAYAGFDPTASSLHVGHLVTMNVMRALQEVGVRPIIVFGGATGAIGDPSGRDVERPLQSHDELRENMESMQSNLARLIDFNCDVAPALREQTRWSSTPWLSGLKLRALHVSFSTWISIVTDLCCGCTPYARARGEARRGR